MLILLPPSEGKTAPALGAPVDPASLYLPSLATARKRVLSKLVALCKRTSARSVSESLRALGLTDGQKDEVARNAGLLAAPTAVASEIYTGVLYEALDIPSLSVDARDWVHERAVVFSGLWGVVRLGDQIPAYRCSIGSTLPAPVGGLTSYWKKVLNAPLTAAAADEPVVDLRSGAYAAMWTPPAGSASVRVLHERDGKRSVVSHFNKATKGRLVRALASSEVAVGSVDQLVEALRDLKFTIEEQPVAAGRPRSLDVIVKEL